MVPLRQRVRQRAQERPVSARGGQGGLRPRCVLQHQCFALLPAQQGHEGVLAVGLIGAGGLAQLFGGGDLVQQIVRIWKAIPRCSA